MAQLDIETVCVTAMYMALGAERVLKEMDPEKYEEIVEHCSGHIGIMGELAEMAVKSERKVLEKERDYSGVFDYEVSEPFGAWYVETRLNHTGDATEELYRRIDEFFTKYDPKPESDFTDLPCFDNGDNEQLPTCPQCGRRTNFVGYYDDDQVHECPSCSFKFRLSV